jgi:hypothetical protein
MVINIFGQGRLCWTPDPISTAKGYLGTLDTRACLLDRAVSRTVFPLSHRRHSPIVIQKFFFPQGSSVLRLRLLTRCGDHHRPLSARSYLALSRVSRLRSARKLSESKTPGVRPVFLQGERLESE